jgi:hypothetical protein
MPINADQCRSMTIGPILALFAIEAIEAIVYIEAIEANDPGGP